MPVNRLRTYYGGWTPDLPDQRDFLYSAPLGALGPLPPSVDLRPQFEPVYDQGQLGSCTANAIAGAIQFTLTKEGLPSFAPSRLFIYYNERVIEGTVGTDSGAQLRDGIKTVNQQGVCEEVPTWPYDITDFTVKPPAAAYTQAALSKVTSYQSLLQQPAQLKGCLASGYPFVFGFTVYDSFETPAVAQSGEVPLPVQGEQVVGGHAVVAVGYDDATQQFIIRNSWGPGWGINGYFYLPYAYVTDANLATDFWTIRVVA